MNSGPKPSRPAAAGRDHHRVRGVRNGHRGGQARGVRLLLKPVDLHHLRATVARAVELRRMRSVPAVIAGAPAQPDADEIVGTSPAMQAVYRAVGLFARQAVPVLITGESGTGKELVARTLFQHSDRADRPLLALDCAATPEAALEEELFGHDAGARGGRRKVGSSSRPTAGPSSSTRSPT